MLARSSLMYRFLSSVAMTNMIGGRIVAYIKSCGFSRDGTLSLFILVKKYGRAEAIFTCRIGYTWSSVVDCYSGTLQQSNS